MIDRILNCTVGEEELVRNLENRVPGAIFMGREIAMNENELLKLEHIMDGAKKKLIERVKTKDPSLVIIKGLSDLEIDEHGFIEGFSDEIPKTIQEKFASYLRTGRNIYKKELWQYIDEFEKEVEEEREECKEVLEENKEKIYSHNYPAHMAAEVLKDYNRWTALEATKEWNDLLMNFRNF